ncbi:MAG: HEAT repeat domain-containing protein [Vicinamibacterales bacterium]
MTIQLVEDTAATIDEPEAVLQCDDSSSSTAPEARSAKQMQPGMLVAALLVAATLTAGGATGVSGFRPYFAPRRLEEWTDSATGETECSPELTQEVRDLFALGSSEFFEDGLHSRFSRALLMMLSLHGRAAVLAIRRYVQSADPKPDVVSEALRWLADIADPTSLPERWALLQDALNDGSPRVRDGAILGFAALDDPRALPMLRLAREHEPIDELRRLLSQVMTQLTNTEHATAVADGSRESLV